MSHTSDDEGACLCLPRVIPGLRFNNGLVPICTPDEVSFTSSNPVELLAKLDFPAVGGRVAYNPNASATPLHKPSNSQSKPNAVPNEIGIAIT
jgi:hypothetical protein